MKKTKKFSRLLALALAVVMMMGMAVTASADNATIGDGTSGTKGVATNTSGITVLSITTTLLKDSKDYAPSVTFEYSVAAETVSSESIELNGNSYSVVSGVSDGVLTDDTNTGKAVFAPATGDIGQTSVTKTASFTVNASKFSGAGIYKYKLSQTTITTSGNYEGITYDSDSVRYLYVIVTNENSGLIVTGIVMYDSATTPTKSSGFTNMYGLTTTNTEGDTPTGTVNDLILTKTVDGTLGDKSKEFEFTVTVGTTGTGEQYYLEYGTYSSGFSTSTDAVTLTAGTSATIKIKSGDAVKIHGLTAADTYTIVETAAGEDGYTTKIESTDTGDTFTDTSGTSWKSTSTTSAKTVSGSIDAAQNVGNRVENTVTYTNTKNSSTPTGVILAYGPYAAMVVIALGACVIFFRRRRSTID